MYDVLTQTHIFMSIAVNYKQVGYCVPLGVLLSTSSYMHISPCSPFCVQGEEQVVEWAYTQSGLLQGRGGQVLMGSPGPPVSARI